MSDEPVEYDVTVRARLRCTRPPEQVKAVIGLATTWGIEVVSPVGVDLEPASGEVRGP